jgi:hypothetical protein
MPIDFSTLLSADYLFNLNPGPLLPQYFKIIVPFFALMVIFGFMAKKIAKGNSYPPVKKFFIKLYYYLITFGVLGLLYIFFRQQSIYLLSAPVWLVAWLLAAVVWGIFVLKYYFTDRPKEMDEVKDKKEKEKYLPR